MGKKYYKDYAKDDWYLEDGSKPGIEQLKFGVLQRIADASERSAAAQELMAKNYKTLIQDREWFERQYHQERAERERLQRSITAHKANYTRLKRKFDALKQSESEARNGEE